MKESGNLICGELLSMSCLFYGFGKIWNAKVKLGLVVVAWQGLLIVLMMACAQYSQDLTHSHIGLSPT
jgi:hypothetical protein